MTASVARPHLLDAVDAPLIRLGDVQHAQVRQGDGLGRLQGGADRRPAHQVVVDAGHLAVDGPARHDAHLQALRHLIGGWRKIDVLNERPRKKVAVITGEFFCAVCLRLPSCRME